MSRPNPHMLTIETADQAPERFKAWREAGLFGIDRTSVGVLRDYYPAAFAQTHRDATFAILNQDTPLAIVPATIGDACLDYFKQPLRFFYGGDLSAEMVDCAFAHIDSLVTALTLRGVAIRDDEIASRLSVLGKACLNRKYCPAIRLTALADLRDGEAGLRRGLRKSFKSLLNWGKANLELRYVDAANPDRALFDRYHQFHVHTAGRATRSQDSWDAMYALIAAGRGELVLGFLPGDVLVAGTMVFDARGSAHYVSGVYDRERFDKPMAHWPLWIAMLRAHERGQTLFELGEVPAEGTASAKDVSIGYFKRGFATEIATALVWRWTDPASPTA